jgi:CRISPR-associated protein Cas5d
MKVERVSYDVMTPSAARGILTAIHWKPAISWEIEQIDVLKPGQWESIRRNEVGCTMSPTGNGFFVDDPNIRQQRAALILRDVDYVIFASFEMTSRAGNEDNIIKHREMFLRRAEKGQCFYQPYLGCREFPAHFALIPPGEPTPQPKHDISLGFGNPRELGYMLYDIFHDTSHSIENKHSCNDKCRPYFFKAKLEEGHLKIPPINSLGVCP